MIFAFAEWLVGLGGPDRKEVDRAAVKNMSTRQTKMFQPDPETTADYKPHWRVLPRNVSPLAQAGKRVRAAPTNIVAHDNTPLHVKRGWRREPGNVLRAEYRGYYRTKHGAWKGKIRRRGDIFRVYILNPPIRELKNHSRGICFYIRENGWYEIELALQPKDRRIDGVIFSIERIIYESFQMSSG